MGYWQKPPGVRDVGKRRITVRGGLPLCTRCTGAAAGSEPRRSAALRRYNRLVDGSKGQGRHRARRQRRRALRGCHVKVDGGMAAYLLALSLSPSLPPLVFPSPSPFLRLYDGATRGNCALRSEPSRASARTLRRAGANRGAASLPHPRGGCIPSATPSPFSASGGRFRRLGAGDLGARASRRRR